MPKGSASNSAAEPAPSQLQPSALASESETLTLHEVARKLSEDAMQEGAEELLQDTRILQTWQQSKKASNKVRDDMLKLGTHWNVARNVNQKKSDPSVKSPRIWKKPYLRKQEGCFKAMLKNL